MAATDELLIDLMRPDEAVQGLRLSDEAGWNQTLQDWGVFLELGTVFACRAPEIVGTAALLPYGDIAWIGMVLVTAAWRRRGLATALLERVLDEAERRRLQPRLDATPAGAAVYQPLGFRALGSLTRFRRRCDEARPPDESPEPDALARLIALDARAFGRERAALLRALAGRPGSRLYRERDALCLVRDGRRARQIGPLLGAHESRAVRLLDRVLGAEPGPLVIDVFDRAGQVHDCLLGRGFAVERPFRRMARDAGTARGASDAVPDAGLAFAAAGPEFG